MPNAAFYASTADIAKIELGTSIGIMDCSSRAAGIAALHLTASSPMTGGFAAAFGLLIAFTIMSVVAVLLFQKPTSPSNNHMVAPTMLRRRITMAKRERDQDP